MSMIYLITNNLNNKKYVGLTTRNLEVRWKEHTRHKSQYIDRAINKYGQNNFSITLLEECSDETLDEREKYWIDYYDTYRNGYNLTPGGRNDSLINYSDKFLETKKLWQEGYGQKDISKKLNLNIETVHNYLLKNNITEKMIRERANHLIGLSKSKPVLQYDLNDILIKEWSTAMEAAETLGIKSKYITATCRGQQKTYNKMKWIYKDVN